MAAATDRITEEEVRRANIGKVTRLCIELGVECGDDDTIDEIKQKLINRIHEDTGLDHDLGNISLEERRQGQAPVHGLDAMQILLDRITQKFQREKDELLQIYSTIQCLVHRDDFDQYIQQEMYKRYGDCLKIIKTNKVDLETGDLPIIVTGETSSGKSSFLNLLMGADILPTSVLRCTGAICRLRNSSTNKIVVTDYDGQQTCFENMTETELKDKIKEFTTTRQGQVQERVKYVDIFRPIPILRGNFTIVDTPGVSDDTKLTSRLFEYLPMALAFIYVLNTPNDGGTQTDRLGKIFSEQKKRKEMGERYAFDTRAALFICNKWDQIPIHERNAVFDEVIKSLRYNWPGITDSQVYKFSVLEEKQAWRQTNQFRQLYQAINRLVPASLYSKSMNHVCWCKDFLQSIQHLIATRINICGMDQQARNEFEKRILRELDLVKQEVGIKTKQLNRYIDAIRDTLSLQLYQHLHNPETRKKMFSWIEEECPDVKDYPNLEKKVNSMVLARISKEISYWYNNPINDVQNHIENIKKEFVDAYDGISKNINIVKQNMDGVYAKLLQKANIQPKDIAFRMNFGNLHPVLRLIIEAFMEPIFHVFAFGPLLVKGLFDIGLYERNKLKYMDKCTDDVLKALTEKKIQRHLNECCFDDIKAIVKENVQSCLSQHIQHEENLVRQLKTTSAKHVLILYSNLKEKCKTIFTEILFLELFSISERNISFADITLNQVLGTGHFSTVWKAEVQTEDQTKIVAVKRMNEVFGPDTSFEQLSELDCLRMLEHRNIVQMIGQSIRTEQNGSRHVCIIMELCDNTLEGKMTELPACCSFKGNTAEFRTSFTFYADVGTQLCKGLQYIHHKGFVHRDLKIDNVLVKDGIIKISDVGRSKKQDLQTGTIAGHLVYSAPEVLMERHDMNTTAIDVYSLAFLLWELWYGIRVYNDRSFFNHAKIEDFLAFVKSGGRPNFNRETSPFLDLQKLIASCWHTEPNERPSLVQICKTIQQQNHKMQTSF